MRKSKWMVGSTIMLALLLVAGGTLAWFTASADPVNNNFTAGTLKIELIDEFEGADNVNPGDCYDKIVYVKNNGTKKAMVRIKAKFLVEGNEVTFADLGGVIGIDLLNGWVHHNGYYYYPKVVEPGTSTKNAIEEVCFSCEMGNEYQGKTFAIVIEADAIQATNGAPTDAGWKFDPLKP